MELLSVIVGLETLKFEKSDVTIYSDSKYVVEAVEKGWVHTWVRKNFKKKKNKDLWLRFLEIWKKHNVKFVWIKGHNNNKENERCDELAVQASSMSDLQVDGWYEKMKEEEEEDELF